MYIKKTFPNFNITGFWPHHAHALIYFFLLIYLFIIFWWPFLIFLVMFMTVWSINLQIMSMWQWRNVATLRFWRRHISRAMYSVSVYPILYKNRCPGKTKQDIHLIFSVFIYSNIVERINKVLKKIGNRPETAESAPSPFAMDSLEIWNELLILRIKTGVWGNVRWKIKGIFSSWIRFLFVSSKSQGIHM